MLQGRMSTRSGDVPLVEIKIWGTGTARMEKDNEEAAGNIREWLDDTEEQTEHTQTRSNRAHARPAAGGDKPYHRSP